MCGIAGIMTRDGRPPDEAVLRHFGEALAHRGPDGRGRYLAGDVGMVHTRLAIIDLATGDQPLFAGTGSHDPVHPDAAHHELADGEPGAGDDGWIALIANGEIYNHVELRDRFTAAAFATQSDCEPPLHLYLAHGPTFAEHLRGMYAIAIHDPRHGSDRPGRLLLARDPFGIKPLYYAEVDQGLAFASEPQALIAAGLVIPRPRPEVCIELLQLQFTTGRETVFSGIDRVLPGETLKVEAGRIVARHRQEALPEGGIGAVDDGDSMGELDRRLADSVLVHQRADVPYGMFLSGGIDSSALLVMMARLNDRPVTAFTVEFPGAAVADERDRARAVAHAVGAEHVEVGFDADDFWRTLPAVAACMDDPACDYATLPSYKLAATARQAGLKVVLTGEGGDELFGGYGRYRRALRPRLLGGRPMRARGALDGLNLLRDGAGWRRGTAPVAGVAGNGRSALQALEAADCADWLPNDLLTKLDRCLMAHGVEGRVPFIDPVLAAFAFRLPDHLKVARGLGKWLLRQWLATSLPEARPFDRKQGFTVPVAEWIAHRGRQLGPLVAAQPGVAEICHPAAVETLFRHADSRGAGQAAWHLLFFALWHSCHVLGQQPSEDALETLAAAA